MRSAGSQISPYQLCTLFALLFGIVYYLVTSSSNSCSAPRYDVGVVVNPPPSRYHVLVTGGAGYIGSHAVKKLLLDGHAVTVIDNLSRGNKGAIDALYSIATPGRLQFVQADLGDLQHIRRVLHRSTVDVVMHFAAVAYVGANMFHPVFSRYRVPHVGCTFVPGGDIPTVQIEVLLMHVPVGLVL